MLMVNSSPCTSLNRPSTLSVNLPISSLTFDLVFVTVCPPTIASSANCACYPTACTNSHLHYSRATAVSISSGNRDGNRSLPRPLLRLLPWIRLRANTFFSSGYWRLPFPNIIPQDLPLLLLFAPIHVLTKSTLFSTIDLSLMLDLCTLPSTFSAAG